MSAARLFVGIDGGQTATQAVVVTASEEIIGRGSAGPADHVDEPPDSRRLADVCRLAVDRALAAGHLPPATPLEAVVIGLSGYDGEVRGAAPDFGSAAVRFVHDAPIALAGAIERRPAVVVIAGTGSVAYGEDAERRSVRVGGYGYLFGDAGSAFAIAREALAAAMAAADRNATTRLGEAALSYFDRPDLRALARAVYLKDISRPALAGFARVVLDAARLGDPEADAIVDRAAQALADLAAHAIARLDLGAVGVPVAFVGGLTANADLVRRTSERLGVAAPSARVLRPHDDPALGAARLAIAGP